EPASQFGDGLHGFVLGDSVLATPGRKRSGRPIRSNERRYLKAGFGSAYSVAGAVRPLARGNGARPNGAWAYVSRSPRRAASLRLMANDPWDVSGFEEAWRPPVRPRRKTPEEVLRAAAKGSRGGARARLARLAARTPEVMVKVTGRTRDPGHLRAHLEYISRNGEL